MLKGFRNFHGTGSVVSFGKTFAYRSDMYHVSVFKMNYDLTEMRLSLTCFKQIEMDMACLLRCMTHLHSTNLLFSSQFIGRWCQTFILVLLIVILLVIRWLTTDWGIKYTSVKKSSRNEKCPVSNHLLLPGMQPGPGVLHIYIYCRYIYIFILQ